MRLLESAKTKKKKGVFGVLFSVLVHLAVLFLAVYATAQARTSERNVSPPTKVTFIRPPTPPTLPEPKPAELEKPRASKPAAPHMPRVSNPAPAFGHKVLTAPVEISTTIPEIDLTAELTNEDDWTGKGVSNGLAKGVKGSGGNSRSTGTQAGAGEGPYSENDVDESVVSLGGVEPNYPEAMRAANIEGYVMAQFIVNEKGRVESGSIKIISSTNDIFAASVRTVLPRMRFKPAKIGGRVVKQLVQLPFQFELHTKR